MVSVFYLFIVSVFYPVRDQDSSTYVQRLNFYPPSFFSHSFAPGRFFISFIKSFPGKMKFVGACVALFVLIYGTMPCVAAKTKGKARNLKAVSRASGGGTRTLKKMGKGSKGAKYATKTVSYVDGKAASIRFV